MDNTEDTQAKAKEDVGDEDKGEEDIQPNIKDIFKSGELSPRSIKDLNKDRRKGRPATSKNSYIQTRSTSARPSENK